MQRLAQSCPFAGLGQHLDTPMLRINSAARRSRKHRRQRLNMRSRGTPNVHDGPLENQRAINLPLSSAQRDTT